MRRNIRRRLTCISALSSIATHWCSCIAVKPGPASQSYGIKVTALAGTPKPVIEMAKRKLVHLGQQQPLLPPQLDLFAQPQPEPGPTLLAIAQELEKIDPDSLAPREALDTLYKLKRLLD